MSGVPTNYRMVTAGKTPRTWRIIRPAKECRHLQPGLDDFVRGLGEQFGHGNPIYSEDLVIQSYDVEAIGADRTNAKSIGWALAKIADRQPSTATVNRGP